MFHGLNAETYDRSYSDRQLVARIGTYLVQQKELLKRLGLFIALTTLIGAAEPVVVSRGLDQVRVADQSAIFSIALQIVTVLFVFAFLNWLGNYLRRRTASRLVATLISHLRSDAFNAVIHHDLSFFDKHQSGKIISRISNDTQELSQTTTLISDLLGQVLVLIVLTAYLFTVSWQMALILVAISPVIVFLGYGFRRVTRAVSRGGFRAIADVNNSIQEAVAGMRIAKNFRQEAAMYADFRQVNQRSFEINLRRAIITSGIFPLLNVVGGMSSALLIYSGGYFVGWQLLSIGAWYLFALSLDRFWGPLTNLASFASQIQSGLSACERIFALMDTEPNVKQIETRAITTPLQGDIQFKQVQFRYTAQQQVLSDFSLHIARGESVAFVGHTGAGKSSLIKLIARYYEFQDGEILIDGRDIRSLDLNGYRKNLGIVSQSPFLFAGTVEDNIRYARPDISSADLQTIVRHIGQGEWVDALPNGLQTEVGERGNRLSLGQRQLVALSRVLAQQPPIFMLDEATASIDPFTERQIQTALNLILKSSTSILIAHRLSTVQAVDRIIVLDKGRIIEQGNHDALIQRGGYYAELFDTYFRHQTADYKVSL